VLVLTLSGNYLLAGLVMIPVALLARLLAVGIPVSMLRPVRSFSPGAVRVLTWGGLRGGISVALALSLPAGSERDTILTMTYLIVVFSVLVQGLTVRPVVEKLTLGR
jgi:CPA1 family monovalent cation:H+ antiporter